ncbi:MAG TPA: 1,2-phenylacetyl-CoA epoxidase subunit PaaC [Gemmatimonadaceae bacterium]|nr:1,2-phenylacetyl-CoA epoxidase subunit PaaC [Gemmatimonadaceae bacterium]
MSARFFDYLLRLGDDRLVLGHRLSEWCGHGPVLEEDIALANIALDLIGHANLLLKRAGEVEGEGRDQDALAFLRDSIDYRNALIVELPKGDYALTIVRQFLFSIYALHQWRALASSKDADLAGIAVKAEKETRYHVRHSGEWLVRFGDGTEESHARAQHALDELWRFTGELFMADDAERALAAEGLAVDCSTLRAAWESDVKSVLGRATLTVPGEVYQQSGGRSGRHTEHLGYLLAEMQSVPRAYPGAKW